jgi:Rieske Fe-S protein
VEAERPGVAPAESPSRRAFFSGLLAVASAAIAAALGAVLGPFVLAPLGRRRGGESADLGPLGALVEAVAGGAPREVVLTRRVLDGYMTRRATERFAVVPDQSAPSGIAVLSVTCTHLGCGVSWSAEKKAFLCPCHGGVYGMDGAVLAGPPPRPLARLPFAIEGGRVRLDLSKLESA